MHRKDYVALAGAICRTRRQHGDRYGFLAAVTENIADVLAADNPRFDRGRFIAACDQTDARAALDRAREAWARTSMQLEIPA